MTIDSNSSEVAKLYDLSFIETICRGNQVSKRKMLETFISTIPLDVIKISSAQQAGDFATVSQLAHKIKPVLATYGITSVSKEIHDIEILARDEPGNSEISKKIELLEKTINLVAQDIKNNIV